MNTPPRRPLPLTGLSMVVALLLGAVAFGADEPGPAPAPTPPPEGVESGGESGGEPAGGRAPVGQPARPKPGDTIRLIFASGDSTEARVMSVEGDAYTVLIGGLQVVVREEDISDLIVLPSVSERFRQMRALIDPADADSMSALANWCFERGLYDESMGVIDDALDRAPDDTGLQNLRDMLRAQIELAKIRRAREAREEIEALLEPEDEEEGASTRLPRPYPDFPLLTDEQINLIKVYEVDLRRSPRILIDRETIDTLVARYAENPLIPTTREGRDAFKRRTPAEILGVMFRVQARELYPEVRVVGHPESLRSFRDHVHAGWLINSCATNRCHGGENARDFILFNRRPTAARSFYTNFLIIERYRTEEGLPLIDYQTPGRSLLLQMGLERSEAITPHPDVFGWKPVFRSRDSRGFQRAVRWIEMMYRPRPEHPVEYFPLGEEAPEAPAPAGEETIER